MTLRSLLLALALAGCHTTLDQQSTNGVTGTFDGKVMKSTHRQVAEGTRCSGTLRRERASSIAKVVVKCGQVTMYDGTGKFTLSVGDPARRDDDSSTFEDAQTSDRDGTPGLAVGGENGRPDGTGGTLTLWDAAIAGAPAYEIAIVL
jgi:hypothetical protein